MVFFVLGYFFPFWGILGQLCLLATALLVLVDVMILMRPSHPLEASRSVPKRLSNGDANTIEIYLYQHYAFTTSVTVVDELPFQFQRRDHFIRLTMQPGERKKISYTLTPTKRGRYGFGSLNIYVSSVIGLIERRLRFDTGQEVPVYPSFIQMEKIELQAISNQLVEMGIKQIRRIGHTMEFDQIREYVPGDDIRSINWKATARTGDLMVNQYQDERSQRIYSIIDTGRVMKMPFEGLTMLDYAINTSLAISNIVLKKDDKAGLITFSDRSCKIVLAQKKRTHLFNIQQALYDVSTQFKESDFGRLSSFIHRQVKQRSLLFLYTNFETLSSMERVLPVLKQISSRHLLVTVFFINTELSQMLNTHPGNEEEIYIKTMAEKFWYEKKQIVKRLNQLGIQTILTTPKQLSINTINKYLEIKARGMI